MFLAHLESYFMSQSKRNIEKKDDEPAKHCVKYQILACWLLAFRTILSEFNL